MQGVRVDRSLALDLGLYLGFAVFAAVSAAWSEFYGYRIWGNFATVAYALAAAHAGWLLLSPATEAGAFVRALRSRWTPLALVGVLGMLVPLGVLVVRRLTGVDWLITPFSWAAQPEVWVIERSARLLLHTGSPYVDIAALPRPPEVNDYTPYGPAMSVFGLPRALFGGSPVGDALTDARLVFAAVAVGAVVLALRLLGRPPVPVRAAQIAVATPLTALTWAVAGPDLAILGLLILAAALTTQCGEGWSAAVFAVVVGMKLTALTGAVVAGCYLLATRGRGALGRFAAAFVVVFAALNLPVLLAAPGAFVENSILFIIGLGEVESPAGSPLPGHLIASTGPVGHTLALILLGLAALAIAVWLVIRPPKTGSAVLFRTAVSLGTAILLMPATRWGYLVYPLVLLGAMMCFSVAERMPRPATDHRPLLRS